MEDQGDHKLCVGDQHFLAAVAELKQAILTPELREGKVHTSNKYSEYSNCHAEGIL